MRNWLGKYWPFVLAGAIALFLAIFVQFFRKAERFADTVLQTVSNEIFVFLSDWAIVLSASITLLLVIAAFLSIIENRRLREEERDLDFKKRMLDDIMNWVKDVRQRVSEPRILGRESVSELKESLHVPGLEGEWSVEKAKAFGEGFADLVGKANQNAFELYGILQEIEKGNEVSWDSVVEPTDVLISSLQSVLESAVKLKKQHRF